MARAPEVAFPCPACGQEAVAGIDGQGLCASCHAATTLDVPAELAATRILERCLACGSTLLYVQRDFNQRAGLVLVVIGALLAPFTYYLSLFAAAGIDAALYLLLPEITVCYRCHAHYRGFARNPRHEAFDLHIAEQYDPRPPQG